MLHLAPYRMFYVFLGYPYNLLRDVEVSLRFICTILWNLPRGQPVSIVVYVESTESCLVFFWWRISTKKHCLILRDQLTLQIWPYSFSLPFPDALFAHINKLHAGEKALILHGPVDTYENSVPAQRPAKWILDAEDVWYVGRTTQNIAVFRLQGPVWLQGDGWDGMTAFGLHRRQVGFQITARLPYHCKATSRNLPQLVLINVPYTDWQQWCKLT